MSWLKDRIDLLTSIDEEVTELEAECVVLVAELAIRREELRMATEDRMQAQLELKDKKNDRRVVSVPHTTLTTTLNDNVGDKVQVHDNFTTSSHQSGGVFVGYCIGLTSNTPSFFFFLFSFFLSGVGGV
jgi:putative Ca2+/H+ antiporter (TMEM165/GDT1 family)